MMSLMGAKGEAPARGIYKSRVTPEKMHSCGFTRPLRFKRPDEHKCYSVSFDNPVIAKLASTILR